MTGEQKDPPREDLILLAEQHAARLGVGTKGVIEHDSGMVILALARPILMRWAFSVISVEAIQATEDRFGIHVEELAANRRGQLVAKRPFFV